MAQAPGQDFDGMLQSFLVDLNGDGIPDAVVQQARDRSKTLHEIAPLPQAPFDPSTQYGPQKSEFNAPWYKPAADGDVATVWSGDERVFGIPDPRSITLDGAKNALGSALQRVGDFGSAVAATGGPPGAIIGSGMQLAKSLPATAGVVGEGLGRMVGRGRWGASNAADSIDNALTAPQQFVDGFRRGNVTPREEMAAAWRPMPNDLGGETAAWGKGWNAAAWPDRPPVGLPVEQQITHQSGPPGIILSPSRKAAAEGRRPRDGTFIDQGGGYVAERADPGMVAARRNALAADEVAIDARMGRWNDARTARRVDEGITAQRPEAMADAVVKAYMPQSGFREMFARDPMRVINDLETATGVSKPNIIGAMERAGFDLSFMTRDKFMTREGGQMSGYYAPGGREVFQQIQESPVLYRQRSMHSPENALAPRLKKPGSND